MTDQTGFDPGELFLAVEKPSRYTGGEVNAIRVEDGACPDCREKVPGVFSLPAKAASGPGAGV